MRQHASSGRRLQLDGVCAGLARYFGIDPLWVRVGAVVAAVVMTKLAVAAYAIAWLVLDERKSR